jgi:hypothetical protein
MATTRGTGAAIAPIGLLRLNLRSVLPSPPRANSVMNAWLRTGLAIAVSSISRFGLAEVSEAKELKNYVLGLVLPALAFAYVEQSNNQENNP